jgi:hypothetical protein
MHLGLKTGPLGSRGFKLPEFLDNRHMEEAIA